MNRYSHHSHREKMTLGVGKFSGLLLTQPQTISYSPRERCLYIYRRCRQPRPPGRCKHMPKISLTCCCPTSLRCCCPRCSWPRCSEMKTMCNTRTMCCYQPQRPRVQGLFPLGAGTSTPTVACCSNDIELGAMGKKA